MTSTIRVDRTTPLTARVTFENPPVNLMIPEGIVALHDLVVSLAADPDIKVVVFDSEADDYFINHFDGERAADLPAPIDGVPVWVDLVDRLTKAPFVTIAKVRGRARGAGSELALACDLRYASQERAFFGQPEVGIGIVPGGGGTEWLPRALGRDRALEVILTSADYDADVAERWGWVTRTLPDAGLDAYVDAIVGRLATFDRQAMAAAKTMVNRASRPPIADFVAAFEEFGATLGHEGYARRAQRLGELLGQNGLDVEVKLGDYIAQANQPG